MSVPLLIHVAHFADLLVAKIQCRKPSTAHRLRPFSNKRMLLIPSLANRIAIRIRKLRQWEEKSRRHGVELKYLPILRLSGYLSRGSSVPQNHRIQVVGAGGDP